MTIDKTLQLYEGSREQLTLSADGNRWHLEAMGSGPSLLFLPGGTAKGRLFFDQMVALAPHFRCVAVDLPPVAEPEDLIASLATLIRDHLHPPVHLVAQGTGVNLSQLLLRSHPDLVEDVAWIQGTLKTQAVSQRRAKAHAKAYERVLGEVDRRGYGTFRAYYQKKIEKSLVKEDHDPFWAAFYRGLLEDTEEATFRASHERMIRYWRGDPLPEELLEDRRRLGIEAETERTLLEKKKTVTERVLGRFVSAGAPEKKALVEAIGWDQILWLEGGANHLMVRHHAAITKALLAFLTTDR